MTDEPLDEPGKRGGLDWSRGTRRYARLVALWADPALSMSAIGVVLGCSKNQIAGAVHRLELPSRVSPIIAATPEGRAKRAQLAAQRAVLRVTGRVPVPGYQVQALPASANTLPSLASVVAARTPRRRLVPVKVPPAIPRPLIAPSNPQRRCMFPIGTPGQRDFRWCDAPISQAGPYCEECRAICYLRVRDLREPEPTP